MELVRLFVIVLDELFQIRAKVSTVGIRRIGSGYIVFCREQFKKSDGIPSLTGQKCIALCLCILFDSSFQILEESGEKSFRVQYRAQ